MTVCIAGMHRSGTSMIARLLNLCGVYLGPDAEMSASAFDNEAGFWENRKFVRLNEDALAQLGGGWDLPPPMAEGWELGDEMIELRNEAAKLIERFDTNQIWGWKDPRNSIMLPFWKRLIPELKTVVCLRNPIEVARSLHKRGFSSPAFGLHLWLIYSQRLFSSTLPSERVVTHYNSYFHNPQAELRRVLKLLKISTSEQTIDQACSSVSTELRHNWVMTPELMESKVPADVLNLYLKMCDEAGAVYRASAAQVH